MLIDGYRQLSQGHRHAVSRLVDTLLEVQEAESCPKIRKLTFFERSLAAGIGDPTEFEDEGEPIFLYASEAVDRADCVFSVNGDSMEPDYPDGCRVFVRTGEETPIGGVGVFVVDGEFFIKQRRTDCLFSLNRNHTDIRFYDGMDVANYGRVIGIVDEEDVLEGEELDRVRDAFENSEE